MPTGIDPVRLQSMARFSLLKSLNAMPRIFGNIALDLLPALRAPRVGREACAVQWASLRSELRLSGYCWTTENEIGV